MRKLTFALTAVFCALPGSASILLSDGNTVAGHYDVANANSGYEISQEVNFTLSQTFYNLDITALLSNGNVSTSAYATAYITDKTGAGTTSANVLANSPVAISSHCTACPVSYTLFTGLTLGPGTYHLLIGDTVVDPTNDLQWEAAAIGTPVSTAAGVTYGGHYESFDVNNTNPPTENYGQSTTNPLILSITGSTTSLPEPATWALGAAALFAFACFKHSRA